MGKYLEQLEGRMEMVDAELSESFEPEYGRNYENDIKTAIQNVERYTKGKNKDPGMAGENLKAMIEVMASIYSMNGEPYHQELVRKYLSEFEKLERKVEQLARTN